MAGNRFFGETQNSRFVRKLANDGNLFLDTLTEPLILNIDVTEIKSLQATSMHIGSKNRRSWPQGEDKEIVFISIDGFYSRKYLTIF